MQLRRRANKQPSPSRPTLYIGLAAALLLLIPLFVLSTDDGIRAFLDFGSGVLCLVSLTSAVIWGLLARDRKLLDPQQRLLAQAVHRTSATVSLSFLLLHITTKVVLGHAALIGALVPFGMGVEGSAGLIGFGSVAGYLMLFVGATGVLRSMFVTPTQDQPPSQAQSRIAKRWRALHALAYPAWCAALVHGLYTGREAAGWILTLYSLSLMSVAGVVSLRLLPPQLSGPIEEWILSLLRVRATAEPTSDENASRDPRVSPLPGASWEGDTSQFFTSVPTWETDANQWMTPAAAGTNLDSEPVPNLDWGTGYASDAGSRGPVPEPALGITAAYRMFSAAPQPGGETLSPPVFPQQTGAPSEPWTTPSPPPPGNPIGAEPAPYPFSNAVPGYPTAAAWSQGADPATDPLSGASPSAPPSSSYPPLPGEPWQ